MAAICIGSLCACSESRQDAKDAFGLPSVVSGLLDSYKESVEKNIFKPSFDAYAEDLVEYSYMTEDGMQTAHTELSSSFRLSDGVFGVTAGQNPFVFGDGFAADGCTVRSVTDKTKIQKALDVFIKAFCTGLKDGDFDIAPDSIRAAEDDVEADRVTLRLQRDEYLPAFNRALTAVKNDAETKRYLTDVTGFYGLLHGREESAEELFDAVIGGLENAVKESTDQLIWQRYVYKNKVVAARLKFGDNVIRYICAETENYTELDLSAKTGGKEITLSYEARRTGMSDTYNIRLSNGDEITYFDGTAESAYKSGNIGFELRATKNGSVVNGFKLDISFNGEKKPTYNGSGNYTVKGDKKTFSFELVFNTAENVTVTPAQNGDISLYEAVKKVFY